MGLLQGISELFPVSSLGHGVLVPALLGWHNLVSSQSKSESFFLAFLVGLHVGTAVALLVFYRAKWITFVRGLGRQVAAVPERGVASLWRLDDPATDADYRLLFLLVIATIPVGLTGLLLEHKFRVLFAKPLAAAIFLTINGVLLLFGERLRRGGGRHVAPRPLATLSVGGALAIGCSQILALFAGISRAGASMVAGLLGGLDHEDAANFSFLLATPVILAAGLLKVPDLFGPLGDGVRYQTLVATLCAGVAAYFAVRFLTRYFTTRTLTPFGIYCLVVGAACVVRFA
ncbi:MAG: undecaprenyl-diphosphate phosphatase [Acidimicrobiales bacterium]